VEISDLLDILAMNACVELTRRLLTAVLSIPSAGPIADIPESCNRLCA
jgi:hypothetical protein